jgi:hypothetical protein
MIRPTTSAVNNAVRRLTTLSAPDHANDDLRFCFKLGGLIDAVDILAMGSSLIKRRDMAQTVIEMWRRHYNTTRPDSALGYRFPAPETVPRPPARPVGRLARAATQAWSHDRL